MATSFTGTWIYRSLINDQDIETDFGNLEFGRATLNLEQTSSGDISGTIGSAGWLLQITGNATAGDPAKIRYQGRGIIGGETWVYDYLGFLVPDWLDGINQIDAIVGSIIRTEPHSSGQAEAGFVASWYAIRAE